jgi:hypothetical protein
MRIGGFGAVLVAIFAIASMTGAAVAPDVDERGHEREMEKNGHPTREGASTERAHVPGLAVSEGGYTLEAEATRIERGDRAPFRFRVTDGRGRTVQDFDLEHERRMHLIVVRRDFEGFQHLHPRQLEDGGWEVDLELDEGGIYRAFADFSTEGSSLTLAADLFVPGLFEPSPLPPRESTADAGDGYEVTIQSGAVKAGESAPTRFAVTKDGRRIESVEPYLDADGHLVALREHDQAFLHTHPEGEAGGPGPISFMVEYPTAGRYRLFLQFKHGGEVRTAAFTQVATVGGGGSETAAEKDGHGGH